LTVNGKVGIGTTSFPQQLNITGGIGFANQNAVDKKLYSPADGVLEWMTHELAGQHGFAVSHQGDRRVFLNTNGNSYFNGGNVGIGTNTPTHKFHVVAKDAVGLFESSGNQAYLRLSTNEGFDNRVEITNRPGGCFTVWTAGAGDRFNITKGGNVGIGITNPSTPLHVVGRIATGAAGTSGGAITFYPSDGSAWFHIHHAGGNNLCITHGGDPGQNQLVTIQENGNVQVKGDLKARNVLSISDIRLKTNVTQLTNVLTKLEKIRGVSFEWNESYESLGLNGGHREIGVTAQEVEAVFPELVTTWSNLGYKAVDYTRLTSVLIEAVKELKTENDTLKERIEALEQEYNPIAKEKG
jgi:Chaperone of endosialidase